MEKLQAQERKDNVITFEELGVDRLFVDEAHSFKNLYFYTKMQNVAGLPTSDAQKSSDMFAKCRYMDEITGSKGVVFATGTPVSNSMAEIYTMQRYLQYDRLCQMGLVHFDCWASRFGETVTALEFAPEGKGFRERTRFARFYNLPELMNLFCEVADIKTADTLNIPKPSVEYTNVVAEATENQKKLVQLLSERAAAVHNGRVSPSEDNMLSITTDGRKLGLDQRVVNELLPDEEKTKVNLCIQNTFRLWKETKSEKLTQIIFCDTSTPKSKSANKAEKAFTVYEDIREKLVSMGIPKQEIAFIHEADTDAKKKVLFSKVRRGDVRVLMGSTKKMGEGMNVQDRLIANHDLDCPWRPGDLQQRKGRIERQGNQNKTVHIYRYVTNGTFDAYLWQTVETKQKFISQIMTSKSPVRSCEDVDQTALSYAEIKEVGYVGRNGMAKMYADKPKPERPSFLDTLRKKLAEIGMSIRVHYRRKGQHYAVRDDASQRDVAYLTPEQPRSIQYTPYATPQQQARIDAIVEEILAEQTRTAAEPIHSQQHTQTQPAHQAPAQQPSPVPQQSVQSAQEQQRAAAIMRDFDSKMREIAMVEGFNPELASRQKEILTQLYGTLDRSALEKSIAHGDFAKDMNRNLEAAALKSQWNALIPSAQTGSTPRREENQIAQR